MSSTRLFQNGLDRQIALIRIGELAVQSVKCENALTEAIGSARRFNSDQNAWNEAKLAARRFHEKKRELEREVVSFIEHDHANGGAPGHTGEVKE